MRTVPVAGIPLPTCVHACVGFLFVVEIRRDLRRGEGRWEAGHLLGLVPALVRCIPPATTSLPLICTLHCRLWSRVRIWSWLGLWRCVERCSFEAPAAHPSRVQVAHLEWRAWVQAVAVV